MGEGTHEVARVSVKKRKKRQTAPAGLRVATAPVILNICQSTWPAHKTERFHPYPGACHLDRMGLSAPYARWNLW